MSADEPFPKDFRDMGTTCVERWAILSSRNPRHPTPSSAARDVTPARTPLALTDRSRQSP
jgi:hypothetical protein